MKVLNEMKSNFLYLTCLKDRKHNLLRQRRISLQFVVPKYRA